MSINRTNEIILKESITFNKAKTIKFINSNTEQFFDKIRVIKVVPNILEEDFIKYKIFFYYNNTWLSICLRYFGLKNLNDELEKILNNESIELYD